MIYFIKQVRRNGIKTYYFQKMKAVRPFRRNICSGILTLDNAPEEQIHSQNMIEKIKESTKIPEKKQRKTQSLNNKESLLRRRQKALNGFENKVFIIEKKA